MQATQLSFWNHRCAPRLLPTGHTGSPRSALLPYPSHSYLPPIEKKKSPNSARLSRRSSPSPRAFATSSSTSRRRSSTLSRRCRQLQRPCRSRPAIASAGQPPWRPCVPATDPRPRPPRRSHNRVSRPQQRVPRPAAASTAPVRGPLPPSLRSRLPSLCCECLALAHHAAAALAPTDYGPLTSQLHERRHPPASVQGIVLACSVKKKGISMLSRMPFP